MNLTERHLPYYWVTWLTKLLAGENMCLWAAWLRGHYKYKKTSNDGSFDLNNWIMEHTAALRKRADRLRATGYNVTIEDENPLKIVGKDGTTIAGKIDIVARKKNILLVEDIKTGKKRTSDHSQVGIYMLFHPERKNKQVFGNVIYNDGPVKVKPMNPELLRDLMQQLKKEPKHTPSVRECKYCDIEECPKRRKSKAQSFDTDLF
jgi:hypothetical protein